VGLGPKIENLIKHFGMKNEHIDVLNFSIYSLAKFGYFYTENYKVSTACT
jgi:hypothetical protein